MKRKSAIALAGLMSACFLTGCSNDGNINDGKYELPHHLQTSTSGMNKDLYYQNDCIEGSDPSIVYCDNEADTENYGWFFLYTTGVFNIPVYKSRDLNNWQSVGLAFSPAQGSWAREQVYAPECVYSDGKYYLFFSANDNYYRPDGMFFTSRDDQKAYYVEKVKIDAMDLAAASARMDEQIAKFDGKTELEGYSDNQLSRAQENIDKYKSLKAGIDASESEQDEKDAELLEITRTALAEFEAMEVNADLYLGYSATFSIGLAVSDSPAGPFVQYTNVAGQEGYDPNKREISIGEPFVTHEDLAGVPIERRERIMSHIDVNPFEDPKTHKKYMYLSNTYQGQTEMYGVEIGDDWTDDLNRDSVTHMTTLGYKDVDKTEPTDYIISNKIEEGPHMYYDAESDNYYLTFSINGCYDRNYSVAQALGKSPLGKFTKVNEADGGILCAADPYWDHVTATGHHCFVKYGDKMYIAYQTLMDRAGSGSGPRGICVDEVKFITNDKGQKLLYTNGPTYSPMPKIGPDAQYRNIAESATVTATNGEAGMDAKYLNDGLLTATLVHEIVKEYDAKKGKTEITLTFDDYRTVRAIMVFNSKWAERLFDEVSRIELDFVKAKDGKDVTGTAYMSSLKFEKDRYLTAWEGDEEEDRFARPCGAVAVEFDEIKVKTIRITINSDKPISVSEIMVLGK